MIRTNYRTPTGEHKQKLSTSEIAAALKAEGGCLWIDICYVEAQKPDIEKFLKENFQFHPLALDDALHEAHLSRVDDWQSYAYLVVHGLELELNCTLDPHELDAFIGTNYMVTLHEEPIAALDKVWEQCGRGIEARFGHGPDHLLYVLLDSLVTDYMKVVDGLDDEIDAIEQEIYSSPARSTVNRIFRLRRTLLRLRRLLGYLRETLNRLARDDFAVIDEKERIYFRDAYDHVVRLFEIAEGLRDMAAGAMESFMSVTSNRINEAMRTLTVVTVLFMPLSTIVGFFGMNFFGEAYNVPAEPGRWFWLATCLLLLAGTPFGMLWWIKRKGWLKTTLMEKQERLAVATEEDEAEEEAA